MFLSLLIFDTVPYFVSFLVYLGILSLHVIIKDIISSLYVEKQLINEKLFPDNFWVLILWFYFIMLNYVKGKKISKILLV